MQANTRGRPGEPNKFGGSLMDNKSAQPHLHTSKWFRLRLASVWLLYLCFPPAHSVDTWRATVAALAPEVGLASRLPLPGPVTGQQQQQPVQPVSPLPLATLRASNRQIEKQIVDRILGEGYDKRIRPTGQRLYNSSASDSGNDGPTEVKVNTLVRSISKIDDVTMEYSVQLTLRQEWTDERLAFSRISEYKGYNVNSITLTEQERLWKPDLFFRNEKEGHFHKIIMPNVLLRIQGNGEVLYSIRISLVLACPMLLKYYPLDQQNCTIEMASYGYLEEDLKFSWKEKDPVQIQKPLFLPRFTLEHHTPAICTSRTTTGTYSCLRINLIFKREFSYYLIQIYIPCCMLVIVSWVSFWLDPNAIPARVSLGVTTLLTMATQISGINASLPPVSYIKAIDVWTGVCLTFVFGALLEFALVNYASRSDQHRREMLNSALTHSQQLWWHEAKAAAASAGTAPPTSPPPDDGTHFFGPNSSWALLAGQFGPPPMTAAPAAGQCNGGKALYGAPRWTPNQHAEHMKEERAQLLHGRRYQNHQPQATTVDQQQHQHQHHRQASSNSTLHQRIPTLAEATNCLGGSQSRTASLKGAPLGTNKHSPKEPNQTGTTCNGAQQPLSTNCLANHNNNNNNNNNNHHSLAALIDNPPDINHSHQARPSSRQQSRRVNLNSFYSKLCHSRCGRGPKRKNWCQMWLAKFPTRSKRIDVISRIFFPLKFALFNLVYWSTYLFIEENKSV